MIKIREIWTLLFLLCLATDVGAVKDEDIVGRDDYIALVQANKCLPNDVDEETLDAVWRHRKVMKEIRESHHDILPPILSDGQIRTQNGMGFQWGFHPAIVTKVDEILKDKLHACVLDMGCAYGLDSLALVRNYPNAWVTGFDADAQHIEYANQLSDRFLSEDEKMRFQAFSLQAGSKRDVKEDSFDLTIVSAVLHFYSNTQIRLMLRGLYRGIKPGGHVVLANLSDRYSWFVGWQTTLFGHYYHPVRGAYGKPLSFLGMEYSWFNHMGQDQMRNLAEGAGFTVIRNEYVGVVNTNSFEDASWYEGVDPSQCILFTTLKRPED